MVLPGPVPSGCRNLSCPATRAALPPLYIHMAAHRPGCGRRTAGNARQTPVDRQPPPRPAARHPGPQTFWPVPAPSPSSTGLHVSSRSSSALCSPMRDLPAGIRTPLKESVIIVISPEALTDKALRMTQPEPDRHHHPVCHPVVGLTPAAGVSREQYPPEPKAPGASPRFVASGGCGQQ